MQTLVFFFILYSCRHSLPSLWGNLEVRHLIEEHENTESCWIINVSGHASCPRVSPFGRWIQNSWAEGSLSGSWCDFEVFICSLCNCQWSYPSHGSSEQFLKLTKHFGLWQGNPKDTFYIDGHFLFIVSNYFLFIVSNYVFFLVFKNLSVLGDLLF